MLKKCGFSKAFEGLTQEGMAIQALSADSAGLGWMP
jgi:hypothetical protein